MQAKEFKLHKFVETNKVHGTVYDDDILTLKDTGKKVTFVDVKGATLCVKVSQIVGGGDLYSIMQAFYTLFGKNEFSREFVSSDAFDNVFYQNVTWENIINIPDTSNCDYNVVNRKMSVDEYSFITHAQVIGEYWTRSKTTKRGVRIRPRLKAMKIAYARFGLYGEIVVPVSNGDIAFKSYGLTSLWALVKPAISEFALAQAKELTQDACERGLYHHVQYKLHRCDIGEGV